jgi:hypothetical protein
MSAENGMPISDTGWTSHGHFLDITYAFPGQSLSLVRTFATSSIQIHDVKKQVRRHPSCIAQNRNKIQENRHFGRSKAESRNPALRASARTRIFSR